MRKTLTWIGIGAVAVLAYTYGAKAGRRRYREIRAAAQAVWNEPHIRKARERALEEADRLATATARHLKTGR